MKGSVVTEEWKTESVLEVPKKDTEESAGFSKTFLCVVGIVVLTAVALASSFGVAWINHQYSDLWWAGIASFWLALVAISSAFGFIFLFVQLAVELAGIDWM